MFSKGTWRRCTTFQERLTSDLTKMSECIRNILQGTWRRCCTVRKNVLQITERSCSDVSGTSCMLLKEVVPTYQECLQSYFKKMLQCIRNVLHVTWRSCSKASGTFGKLPEEDLTTYQESLASYLKTWRSVVPVSGTSCKLLAWRRWYNVGSGVAFSV